MAKAPYALDTPIVREGGLEQAVEAINVLANAAKLGGIAAHNAVLDSYILRSEKGPIQVAALSFEGPVTTTAQALEVANLVGDAMKAHIADDSITHIDADKASPPITMDAAREAGAAVTVPGVDPDGGLVLTAKKAGYSYASGKGMALKVEVTGAIIQTTFVDGTTTAADEAAELQKVAGSIVSASPTGTGLGYRTGSLPVMLPYGSGPARDARLNQMKAALNAHAIYQPVHNLLPSGIKAPITAADASDDATAIALAAQILPAYLAHIRSAALSLNPKGF